MAMLHQAEFREENKWSVVDMGVRIKKMFQQPLTVTMCSLQIFYFSSDQNTWQGSTCQTTWKLCAATQLVLSRECERK